MNNIKILHFGRTDISEGIDVNKTRKSKECDICNFFFFFDIWYFLNKRFQCQPYVCNRYHDLLMMSVNLSYIAILKIKNTDYSCIINRMSKSEAIKLLQNIDSTEKT